MPRPVYHEDVPRALGVKTIAPASSPNCRKMPGSHAAASFAWPPR